MTARFSQGKYSLAISDRDGQAYPYTEMVKEWTGAWVHISEFEPKSPQLELKVTGGDPQALQHPRTARTEFETHDFITGIILFLRQQLELQLFEFINQDILVRWEIPIDFMDPLQ